MDMTPTSTITETDPPTTEAAPSLLASLPKFGRPRLPYPSAANPDQDLPIGDEHQCDEPAAAAAARSSSGTPTSIQAFFKQRAKSYQHIAETLFKAIGGLLNARTVDGEISEAFLPDDDDLETVGPPLGRLAARRIKIGADPAQLTDVEDLGIAAVGLAAWLGKGITAALEARRARKRIEQDKAVYKEGAEQ
jgi:hypothetical protein